ncbi:hypothetical protein CDL12_03088 [Handroanthus impetiginosus]|uniref:PGG domain-containing protein n=1 Tax=Handroanthus impetiginosus TaxID=429701 RepID=A0A2G9I358_9LAMI|nr:hypothetical protein CDL12_03088 [Handroanthus impetiginosus]
MEKYKASENCSESGLRLQQPQRIDENPKISSETTDAVKINEISCDDEEYEKPKISSKTTVKKKRVIPVFRRRKAFRAGVGKKRYKSTQKSKSNRRRELEKYREALTNAKDTTALLATLIATFTYSSGVNPPGGMYQDGPLIGTPVAARRTAFKVFTVCNNLALFLALVVVVYLVGIVPTNHKVLNRVFSLVHFYIQAAISFLAAAYVAALVVIMKPVMIPPRKGLDWTVVLLLTVCGVTGMAAQCHKTLLFRAWRMGKFRDI